MKSAFIAVIGRPSSGKSTLVNTVCGHKVSIVAPAPQTTRNAVRGILTREKGQLVFVDTPGYHTSERRFNNHMKQLVIESLNDVEIILYVIDSTRKPGVEEQALRELVSTNAGRVAVAINKTDLPGDANPHNLLLEGIVPPDRVHYISALNGDGVEALIDALYDMSPDGDQMYPEEFYTDQDPEFRAAEIIREKTIVRLKQELPHSVYVDIADMEKTSEETLWIRGFILVERESQKGIVVGKGGTVIRDIRKASEKELSDIFPYDVKLDLRVKVNKEWRKNDTLLRRLIR